MSNVVKD